MVCFLLFGVKPNVFKRILSTSIYIERRSGGGWVGGQLRASCGNARLRCCWMPFSTYMRYTLGSEVETSAAQRVLNSQPTDTHALGLLCFPPRGEWKCQEAQEASGCPCKHQEGPGRTKRPQEDPGGPRKTQEAPGGTKRTQEAPGGPRRPQEAPGEPGGPRKHQAP